MRSLTPKLALFLLCGAALTAAVSPSAAAGKTKHRVSVKVPNPSAGDLTLAEVSIRVRSRHGGRLPKGIKMRVRDARKLPGSISVVGGIAKAKPTRKARARRPRSALYRALVAIANVKDGTAATRHPRDSTNQPDIIATWIEFAAMVGGNGNTPYISREDELEDKFDWSKDIIAIQRRHTPYDGWVCDGTPSVPPAESILNDIGPVRFIAKGDGLGDTSAKTTLGEAIVAACDEAMDAEFLRLIGADPANVPGTSSPGGTTPFSCSGTGSIIAGQLNIEGSCNQQYDQTDWQPLNGGIFNGPWTVEHSVSCPLNSTTHVTCNNKTEANNPSHLWGASFTMDPAAAPGEQIRVQILSGGQVVYDAAITAN